MNYTSTCFLDVTDSYYLFLIDQIYGEPSTSDFRRYAEMLKHFAWSHITLINIVD